MGGGPYHPFPTPSMYVQMASDAPPTQTSIVPSKLQVAFAIAIVKTKPNGITIRDYTFQLRRHLKRGRQVFTKEEERRYLDIVSYCRDRYERAESKCNELEQRIVHLERANDHLQAQIQQPINHVPESSKRKGDKRSSKRAKGVPGVPVNTVLGLQGTVTDDLEVLDGLGAAGTKLTLTLHAGHKLSKKQHADAEAICFNLIQSAVAIGSVISAVAKHHDHPAKGRSTKPFEKDNSDLSHAIRASARAFSSILVGLGRLSNNVVDRLLPNLVIYECVKMFKTIFESIKESTRQAIATREATEQSGNGKTSRNRAPNSAKNYSAPQTIALFVKSAIGHLDKSDSLHREIFEGFMFILLERVGKRLYYCTFGRDRSATLDGEIAIPPEPDHPAVIARQEKEALAAKLEFQSLITILERAIEIAPNYLNSFPASTSAPSRSKTSGLARTLTVRTLPPASKAPLSSQAMERLQRTLINCMFGEKDGDDFSDVFRMPARLGRLPSAPKVEEKDMNDWFETEVWRLLGWELLGQDREF